MTSISSGYPKIEEIIIADNVEEIKDYFKMLTIDKLAELSFHLGNNSYISLIMQYNAINIMKYLLESYTDLDGRKFTINYIETNNLSYVKTAIEYGSLELLKYLIHRIEWNNKDKILNWPFFNDDELIGKLIKKKQTYMIKYLLDKKIITLEYLSLNMIKFL